MVTAPTASADEYCQLTARPVASVLVIHGGGWTSGSAAAGHDLCSPLAAMGFRVRSLEYPLRTVPGSIEYAQDAADAEARNGRPVYAVGISAGGSIAEYLAVKSRVDGAVAVAPLSDFVDWREYRAHFWDELGMTLALRHRWSPYHNIEAPVPLRIIHSRRDEVIPYEQSVRMAERCGERCELVSLAGGGHTFTSFTSQLRVLEWFARRSSRFASPARGAISIVGVEGGLLSPNATFAVRSEKRQVAVNWRARAGRGSMGANALSVACPPAGPLAHLRCFKVPAAARGKIHLSAAAWNSIARDAERTDQAVHYLGNPLGMLRERIVAMRRRSSCTVESALTGAVADRFSYVGRVEIKAGRRTLVSRRSGRTSRTATQAPIRLLGSASATLPRRPGTATVSAIASIRTLGRRHHVKTRTVYLNLETCDLRQGRRAVQHGGEGRRVAAGGAARG